MQVSSKVISRVPSPVADKAAVHTSLGEQVQVELPTCLPSFLPEPDAQRLGTGLWLTTVMRVLNGLPSTLHHRVYG